MGYVLYSYWRSSSSFRVRAALELKGVAYEIRPVHLLEGGGQQLRPEYRQLNPMAEVPTLVEPDSGFTLSQSVAIMEYLEERHPEPALLPAAPRERALVRQLVEVINGGIQPVSNLKVLRHLAATFGTQQPDHERWAAYWIARGFEGLELLLARHSGQHAFGDAVTLADCAIVPQVYNALRYRVDLGPFPHIARVWDEAMALEAFRRAAPDAQPDAAS
jgi:maleylacetoacetate isomerase